MDTKNICSDMPSATLCRKYEKYSAAVWTMITTYFKYKFVNSDLVS